jgi:hypothetical protein
VFYLWQETTCSTTSTNKLTIQKEGVLLLALQSQQEERELKHSTARHRYVSLVVSPSILISLNPSSAPPPSSQILPSSSTSGLGQSLRKGGRERERRRRRSRRKRTDIVTLPHVILWKENVQTYDIGAATKATTMTTTTHR